MSNEQIPIRLPDVDSLGNDEIRDLASSYLELLGMMIQSLNVCTYRWAYFTWADGAGFNITGHLPEELAAAIREAG